MLLLYKIKLTGDFQLTIKRKTVPKNMFIFTKYVTENNVLFKTIVETAIEDVFAKLQTHFKLILLKTSKCLV